ncbi:MAG: PAS domain-containing protein [Adhaeribacter sp.]
MPDSPIPASRETNHALPFQRIFEAQSGLGLLLSPELIIIGATEAYLQETFTTREQLQGRHVFDVFPDNPGAPNASATKKLRMAIEQALLTKKPHKMELQYDIPDPDHAGLFLERYWTAIHTPVLDEKGEVICILQEPVNVTEEVKARQALKESQAREQAAQALADQHRLRLERLFAQAPAAFALLEGPDLVLKVLNKAFQQLFPGRLLQGLPLFEALSELRNEPIADIIHQVYRTGETFEGKEVLIPVARYQDQPVEDIYWNFIYQALYDARGQVNGVLVFALDVTTFVQTRQQLEQSAADLQALNHQLEQRVKTRTLALELAQAEAERQTRQLHDLFMQAPAAICILEGPDLVYQLVNPGYQQLFPDRVLLGKPILEALPEIKNNRVYDTFRQVYDTGLTHEEPELLIPFIRPEDGVLEDRYFKYIQQARLNEHGQVDGVVVFALEVTEQVAARKGVEASEQQLRLVTDALPVLISYIDRQERYRFANKAYETWFPLKARDLLGRQIQKVIGPQAYPNVKAYIKRALAGERLDFEASMPYRENFIRHIHTSYVPDVRQGRVQGFYSLVTDITEQVEARKLLEESGRKAKEMAQKLAAMNRELQEANEDLGVANQQLVHTNIDLDNFIYTASHDLKAPISNIERLLSELLLEIPPECLEGSEVKKLTAMMQGAVDHFKKTISILTEISKLQKSDHPDSSQVNLQQLMEEVTFDLQHLIKETQARVDLELENAGAVSFSEKNLRSIVYNLVSNALKYRHPQRPARVQVSWTQQAGWLVLRVRDNGLGLSQQNQEKLFTMFRRFHDHVEGSGVGLYMVKRIVDNAGGKIEVDSREGEGTTFTVYLKVS